MSLAPDVKDVDEGRRSERRFPTNCAVEVLPCNATRDWRFLSAQIIDCSLQGLGLLMTAPMVPGEQFIMKLPVAGRIKLLLYTVQHCTPYGKAHHRVGARFSGLATGQPEEHLDQILETLKSFRSSENESDLA